MRVLTAGRINVVAVEKMVATTNISAKPETNNIKKIATAAINKLTKTTFISPNRLKSGVIINICTITPNAPPTTKMMAISPGE